MLNYKTLKNLKKFYLLLFGKLKYYLYFFRKTDTIYNIVNITIFNFILLNNGK